MLLRAGACGDDKLKTKSPQPQDLQFSVIGGYDPRCRESGRGGVVTESHLQLPLNNTAEDCLHTCRHRSYNEQHSEFTSLYTF